MTRKEFIYDWIKALESGDYKQTYGTLSKIEDGVTKHCCLGVICDLGSKLELVKEVKLSVDLFWFDGWAKTMPHCMVDALGLNSGDGYFKASVDKANSVTLADLNDKAMYTFNQIAAFIKRNLENNNPDKLFREDTDFNEEIVT